MIGTTLFLNLLNGLIFKDAANWKDVDTHSIPGEPHAPPLLAGDCQSI